jgi:hypothetical protein
MNDLSHPFISRYRGYFRSMLRWNELDTLWQQLRQTPEKSWYIYAVGETPPQQPVEHAQLEHFIEQIDELLRREHDEDYCGIVYVDNVENPGYIKIYDPHNLGSVCGPGFGPPPFPGWILSLLAPADLNVAFPPPANRRRWWQKLFG